MSESSWEKSARPVEKKKEYTFEELKSALPETVREEFQRLHKQISESPIGMEEGAESDNPNDPFYRYRELEKTAIEALEEK